MNQNYRCEDRERCKGVNLPMVNIYVTQDIPLSQESLNRRCTMTSTFSLELERTSNFKCQPDDVWVVGIPKCGTTWTEEIAWLICNDFDFESASRIPIRQRSIFFEYSGLLPKLCATNTFDAADNLKSPRVLKSHLPAGLLPCDIWKKKVKIIYVARNVKDAVVSFYPFAKALDVFSGSQEEFAEAFMKDDLFYTPYWPHVLEFYHMRNEPNIFFTSYERIKKDLKRVIKELCIFIGRSIPSEEILDKAVEHLSFDSMRKSEAGKALQQRYDRINAEKNNNNNGFRFLRRGVVGSYRDELSEELVRKLDLWSEKFLEEADTSNENVFGI